MAVSLTQHFQLINAVHIQDQIATRINLESRDEFRSPYKFIVPVGVLCVHRLAESVVESLDENQDFGAGSSQVLSRLSE
jgi:hypothetical protein